MENLEKPTIDFWLALNLAQRTVMDKVEFALKAGKLPPLVWFEVLFELEFATDGLRPQELQEILLIRQSNMSRLLQRMQKAELLQEKSTPKDGRGKLMATTEAGKIMSRRMWQCYAPILHTARDQVGQVTNSLQVTEALQSLIEPRVLKHFSVK